MLAEKPLFRCQGLIQPQDMDMYIAKAFKLIRGLEKKRLLCWERNPAKKQKGKRDY